MPAIYCSLIIVVLRATKLYRRAAAAYIDSKERQRLYRYQYLVLTVLQMRLFAFLAFAH